MKIEQTPGFITAFSTFKGKPCRIARATLKDGQPPYIQIEASKILSMEEVIDMAETLTAFSKRIAAVELQALKDKAPQDWIFNRDGHQWERGNEFIVVRTFGCELFERDCNDVVFSLRFGELKELKEYSDKLRLERKFLESRKELEENLLSEMNSNNFSRGDIKFILDLVACDFAYKINGENDGWFKLMIGLGHLPEATLGEFKTEAEAVSMAESLGLTHRIGFDYSDSETGSEANKPAP